MQTQETNEHTVLTESQNVQEERLDDLSVREETEADVIGGYQYRSKRSE
ncbi:MAG: hypothetical protein HOP19_20185 [Acidobacteria bacterium]|nr:hypothetical protein [Acidobacteriota bacterium]